MSEIEKYIFVYLNANEKKNHFNLYQKVYAGQLESM